MNWNTKGRALAAFLVSGIFLFASLSGCMNLENAGESEAQQGLAESGEKSNFTSYGPAYRYERKGWVFIHAEGEPYERGYQHGYLLSAEIADAVHRWANLVQNYNLSWPFFKAAALALFWQKIPYELQQEIRGIADGAADNGATIMNMPIDYADVLASNELMEVLCLAMSLAANPLSAAEGLLGFDVKIPSAIALPGEMSRLARMGNEILSLEMCSAFAATGNATADGKIVMGHNSWFINYIGERWNVILDIAPSEGNHVIMQTFPGNFWSCNDWYINSQGIIILETTMGQGPYNPHGVPIAVRARNAAQYSSNIDEAVAWFENGNNGLYSCEWMIGDAKTNEIAMLELGTYVTVLWRTFDGFYGGCNNPKDPEVIREESFAGEFSDNVFVPCDRDLKWNELRDQYYGRIDAEIGKMALGTQPLCQKAFDGKVTTSEMALQMGTWAFEGNPNGENWTVGSDTISSFQPGCTDLPAYGWTTFYGDTK